MIHFWKKILRGIFNRGVYRNKEIAPDEIFLDSKNLPEFDVHQFEGRIEKPVDRRAVFFLGASFVLIGLIFVGKLWSLQVLQGEAFEARSENNHLRHTTIFANRGLILDRNGEHLVWNGLNPDGDFSLREYGDFSGISHLVGYLKYPLKDKFGIYYDDKFSGRDGVEIYYEDILSGRNGLKITETDALGEVQSENTLRLPKDGENLTLSIDAKVSDKLYETIKETAEKYGFQGGAGVVMDIHTGEILAMSSFPEYDSDIMTQGKETETIKIFLNDKANPFLNRAISGLYIPGSIIKPFLSVAALEENIISPSKEILSTGAITIPNPYNPSQTTIFKDWKAHGLVDMRRAIAVSSNVYFFSIGGGYGDQVGLGITKINSYMEKFGFGKPTNVDIGLEQFGNVPSPEWKKETFGEDIWRVGDTYNTSIGQYGFQVTPIQAVRAIASLANGGYLLTPTIKKLEVEKRNKAEKLSFKEENFKIAREGMRMSVQEGTASGLSMPGISVAGKTGTAELGALKEFVNSWVVGFFPYENPKYAFAVIMERGPRANTIGATFVMRQLLEWMYINTPEYVR